MKKSKQLGPRARFGPVVPPISALLFFLAAAGALLAQETSTVVKEPPLTLAKPAALQEMELRRTARRASAKPLRMIAPYYSIGKEGDSTLFISNTFSDPLEIDATVINQAGNRFPLDHYSIPPTQHLAVPLAQALAPMGKEFETGALSLDLQGDTSMLQAWVVQQRGDSFTEIPLVAAGANTASLQTSFWDAGAFPGVHPEFYLFNAGSSALAVAIAIGRGGDSSDHPHTIRRELLEAGGRLAVLPLSLDPSAQRGWIRFEDEGAPGTLIATGLLVGRGLLAPLTLAGPGDIDHPATYDTIRVPLQSATAPQNPMRAVLTLFNVESHHQAVKISWLDQASGRELLHRNELLGPAAVRSINLGEILRTSTAQTPPTVRIRVEAAAGLLGSAVAAAPSGVSIPVYLYRRSKAHGDGMYPLPDVRDHEVFSTFVNVGSTTAQLLGQIYWDGGTYAMPAFEVGAGESLRLDIASLMDAQIPDVLGRKLDRTLKNGFLQWRTRRGSHELFARTEAKPRGAEGVFGFNCFGCCQDIVTGEVVPASIVFEWNQNPQLQACETEITCNSSMGPYPALIASLSYAAPLSWDGRRISSTDLTIQTVSFTGQPVEQTFGGLTCRTRVVSPIGRANAVVDQCLKDNAPGFDPNPQRGGCVGQSPTCRSCYSCCDNIKKVDDCLCKRGFSGRCSGLSFAACHKCKELCFGHDVEDGTCPSDMTCH